MKEQHVCITENSEAVHKPTSVITLRAIWHVPTIKGLGVRRLAVRQKSDDCEPAADLTAAGS